MRIPRRAEGRSCGRAARNHGCYLQSLGTDRAQQPARLANVEADEMEAMMKLLTRWGVLIEEQGQTYMGDNDSNSDEARVLRPLQAAACTYRVAFGPRAGQKVLTVQGTMPRETEDREFKHPFSRP